MSNLIEFIDFYGTFKSVAYGSVENAARLLKLSEPVAESYKKQINIIGVIINAIREHQKCNFSAILDVLKIPEDELRYYLYAVSVLYPGKLKCRHIYNDDDRTALASCKKDAAVNEMVDKTFTDEMIAKMLGINKKDAVAAKESLPAIYKENTIVQQLKRENEIRDFFEIHPYSSIKEAASVLKIKSQTLRQMIEKMRLRGEDIKFNNTPIAIEREEIAHRVIEMKTQDPALTSSEISLMLGVSVSEVNRAIRDTIKTWQVERADSYDFYFNKTSKSLDEVEAEAWKQHRSQTRPSSRWLEIALIATEKRIAMHGLKAPERIDIRQDIRMTKNERDKIIDAATAADTLDVDFKKIAVTGAVNGDA